MKNMEKKVNRYECPSCGEKNTLYPNWKGRGRYYRCCKCDATFGDKQLDKIWGVTEDTNPLTILSH